MLQMELVTDQTSSQVANIRDEYTQSTALPLKLAKPWIRSGQRVCEYSSFVSVKTAKALPEVGTKFIRVVRNATKKFSMEHLSRNGQTSRRDYLSIIPRNPNSGKDLGTVL